MSLHILDHNLTLIKSIPSGQLFSLIQESEINKADTLRAEVQINEWDFIKSLINVGENNSIYMAVNDFYNKSIIHVYKVSSERTYVDHIELTGVNFAYDELKSRRNVKSVKHDSYTARELLEFTAGSYGWEIGTIDPNFPTFDIDLKYVSHLEVIDKLISETGGEIKFSSELSNGKISNKKIDFVREMSSFKGKRFALGSNLLDVVKEEDSSALYTAMVGTGTTRREDASDPNSKIETITFEDVEWRLDKGDPVDKPLGIPFVEIPEATAEYGYAGRSPRIGYVKFSDEHSPENLLIRTYNELLDASRPKMQFSATVNVIGEDIELGETVSIIKPGSNFRYKTRVFKISRDYLDNSKTEVEFGDKLTQSPSDRLQTLKDKVKEDIKEDLDSYGTGNNGTGGNSGGSGISSYVRDIPVNHSVFSYEVINEPKNTVDAYVDGYIQEFSHDRRPEFSHPLDPEVPDGEFIEDNHIPPVWAPKPDYGGYGSDGPMTIKYLYANDGRIYVSWNDMDMFYLTSEFMDVFQAVHGYYPRLKEDGESGGNGEGEDVDWVLATDDDFEWVPGPTRYTWRYVGDDYFVEIPEKINGEKITDYYAMFMNTHVKGVKGGNKDITGMIDMFNGLKSNSLNLNELNTSGVTSFFRMFAFSDITSLDLSNFDTSSATSMSNMFYSTNYLTSLDISSFDTSNVTNMSGMFGRSQLPSINLEHFDTSNVTDFTFMFSRTASKSINVSGFNTSKARSLQSMFSYTNTEIIDLSSFNLTNLRDLGDAVSMFNNAEATIGYARTTYERDIFNNSRRKPSTLTFVVIGEDDWVTATDEDFTGTGDGDFKYIGEDFYVEIPHKIKGEQVTSYREMFKGANVLGVRSSNSSITDMTDMFNGVQSGRLEVNDLNTSSVEYMVSTFRNSLIKSIDLSGWDTGSVLDMQNMFDNSMATSIDITSFNTSLVTNMSVMFSDSKVKVLNLHNFNTENVIDMSGMFWNSSATSINVSSFDTSQVETMYAMFYLTKVNIIDLRSFDTSNVVDMMYMFQDSSATIGYARTQIDADKYNESHGKPYNLNFEVI